MSRKRISSHHQNVKAESAVGDETVQIPSLPSAKYRIINSGSALKRKRWRTAVRRAEMAALRYRDDQLSKLNIAALCWPISKPINQYHHCAWRCAASMLAADVGESDAIIEGQPKAATSDRNAFIGLNNQCGGESAHHYLSAEETGVNASAFAPRRIAPRQASKWVRCRKH